VQKTTRNRKKSRKPLFCTKEQHLEPENHPIRDLVEIQTKQTKKGSE